MQTLERSTSWSIFQALEKVSLKSYRLKLPLGRRLHPAFNCDFLSKASNSTPLRPQPSEIESGHKEYAIDYMSDSNVDNLSLSSILDSLWWI